MKFRSFLAYRSLLLYLFWIGVIPNASAWAGGNEGEFIAQEKNKAKTFMRKKLVAANKILEGLTNPDMNRVRNGARTMILMNKEAMWTSFKSPSYAQDSADFVRTAERLVKLAKANDLEGASHTYAQLTIQCVSCHRRVRNQGVARLFPPAKAELLAGLRNEPASIFTTK